MPIQYLKEGKKRVIYCISVTFLLGMVAHAYAYVHSSFSHDSLVRIYANTSDTIQKISIGRFLTPLYRTMTHGNIALPWLIGLLALLWISLSVYLVVKMLHLEGRLVVFLLSGIMVTNLTVTAMTATYIFELDADMFALLSAVAAVYLWNRYPKGGLPGTLFIAISLGLYQSYLSVSISLIIIVSIMALLQGDTFRQVFFKGLKGILMIGAGGILYIISFRLVCLATNTALSTGYNGLNNIAKITSVRSFLELMLQAYKDWFLTFLKPHAAFIGPSLSAANMILLCMTVFIVLFAAIKCVGEPAAKVLFLLLVAILPVGMNISFILSNGMVHDLMRYAFWLSYLLVLLLVTWLHRHAVSGKQTADMAVRGVAFAMVLLVIWNNIQTSNAVYLKKDLESEAAISQMTRVLDRLEQTPGYISGVSPVVFAGSSTLFTTMPGFESLTEITGVWAPTVATVFDSGRYKSYFTYVMDTPIVLSEETWETFQTDARVAEMPAFPAVGCIQQLDGVFVVKMSN